MARKHTNIEQIDGNVSLDSDEDDFSSDDSSMSAPSLPQTSDQFSSLPVIYSANARSLFPKFGDFVSKLQNSKVDVAHISETWQDVNKSEHNKKIDTLLNRYGFKWYSFARSKYRDNGTF